MYEDIILYFFMAIITFLANYPLYKHQNGRRKEINAEKSQEVNKFLQDFQEIHETIKKINKKHP